MTWLHSLMIAIAGHGNIRTSLNESVKMLMRIFVVNHIDDFSSDIIQCQLVLKFCIAFQMLKILIECVIKQSYI